MGGLSPGLLNDGVTDGSRTTVAPPLRWGLRRAGLVLRHTTECCTVSALSAVVVVGWRRGRRPPPVVEVLTRGNKFAATFTSIRLPKKSFFANGQSTRYITHRALQRAEPQSLDFLTGIIRSNFFLCTQASKRVKLNYGTIRRFCVSLSLSLSLSRIPHSSS